MITVNRTTGYLFAAGGGLILAAAPACSSATAKPPGPATAATSPVAAAARLIARVIREHYCELPDRGRQWRIRPVTFQNVANDEPEYQVVLNKAPVPRSP
jgi:hypothetical protein